MLISHFVSASGGLCFQTPYGGFALDPTGGLPSPRRVPWPGFHHVNPFHCTILGTPMSVAYSFTDVSTEVDVFQFSAKSLCF